MQPLANGHPTKRALPTTLAPTSAREGHDGPRRSTRGARLAAWLLVASLGGLAVACGSGGDRGERCTPSEANDDCSSGLVCAASETADGPSTCERACAGVGALSCAPNEECRRPPNGSAAVCRPK